MSFVLNQVAAIDSHLERFELGEFALDSRQKLEIQSTSGPDADRLAFWTRLQTLIKSLSTHSNTTIFSADSLVSILRHARLSDDASDSSYESELQWILLGKVALFTHGLVLDTLLKQTVPIGDELWYWGNVVDSYWYTALYSIQTCPIRLMDWLSGAYHEARDASQSLTAQWRHFHNLVHSMINDSSIAALQKRIASPVTLLRNEIRQKQTSLKLMKLIHANVIGHLVSQSFSRLSLETNILYHGQSTAPHRKTKWRKTVIRSIRVMTALLKTSLTENSSVVEFDKKLAEPLSDDRFVIENQVRNETKVEALSPKIILKLSETSDHLQEILDIHLPAFVRKSELQLKENGRPSRLARYWLPAAGILVFSSGISRLWLNRRVTIHQWVRDFGVTVVAFWDNWVLEPSKRLLSTIRHDKGREISITSKESLEADRASLERMVVDFAIANTESSPLQESDIVDLKAKLVEGDLTAVLRVYEKELQHPLMGAIRGKLIQALLIQVQKTKVDVDLAMRGIDALLRSQELVFGFVSLTPGVLVCLAITRYISTISHRRKGTQTGTKLSQAALILRNIDRILNASQRDDNSLNFTEQGLVICEAVALMNIGRSTLTSDQYHELTSDLQILIDIDYGVKKQKAVADRIRRAFNSWLRR